MKNYVIIKNADKDTNFILTDHIVTYLQQQHAKTMVINRTLEEMGMRLELPKQCDCVMVLGGDGSILRTVRAVVKDAVPIVGVNLGNLGYLTQTEPEDVTKLLDRLLQDDVQIENRMMLEGKMFQKEKMVFSDLALNDIVVGRSGLSRIIRLKIMINGELLNVYDADGVIVSTPTGSTAYNLSAGGPVVCPKADLIVVTPISPHSLSARSVILSDKDTLQIMVEQVRLPKENALATFDGQTGRSMEPGDYIEIRRAPYSASLIQTKDTNFYEILRQKMK